MFRDRIATLRDYLRDEVKDARFNLATWVGCESAPWRGMQDLSCGTTACAMGWAATIPSFQALGLHLKVMFSNSKFGVIAYDGTDHFQAAAKFMDLSSDDAEFLFNYKMYPDEVETTRLQVVNRLTDFLNFTSSRESNFNPDEYDSCGAARL